MIDVFDKNLWNSSVPHVSSILFSIHREAISARGDAFSFRVKMYDTLATYKYTSRLFAAPEWKIVDYAYNASEEKAVIEAANCLKSLATYTTEVETNYDYRSNNAKHGDSATQSSTYYARFKVNKEISTQIYRAYETEGAKFREKLLSEYGHILDRIIGNLYWSIMNHKNSGAKWDLSYYPSVTANIAKFSTSELTFSSLGMQPLSTITMRYGFLTAMIERALPQLKPYGTVTWKIGPYNDSMSAEIKLHFTHETLKAW